MDSNWFDTWLKDRLYRDIIFRILVWASIAAMTVWFASSDAGFSGYDFLGKIAKSLFPVLNIVGSTSIILALFALMFKDAEHVDPLGWGENSLMGRFGGVVRRLAADLTLWVVGSLVAILSAVTAALVQAVRNGAMTGKAAAIIASAYIAFAMYLVFTAAINVFVRKAGPLLASPKFSVYLKTSRRVVIFYVFSAGLMIAIARVSS